MFYTVKQATASPGDSPTQILRSLPMLVMEVSGIMRTAANQRTRLDRLADREWLSRLLTDIHEEVTSQPSPQAVERIRSRLLAQIRAPTQAAA